VALTLCSAGSSCCKEIRGLRISHRYRRINNFFDKNILYFFSLSMILLAMAIGTASYSEWIPLIEHAQLRQTFFHYFVKGLSNCCCSSLRLSI
jgi:hypothetical protein